MSDFTFACPHCGKKVKGNDALAGEEAECPHCGGELLIPTPPAARPSSAPDAAPTYLQTPPTHASYPREVWTPFVWLIDKTLGGLRFFRGRARGFAIYQRIVSMIGLYAVLAGGLFMIIFTLICAVKDNAFTPFLTGLAAIPCILALHYVCAKSVYAGQRIVADSRTSIASSLVMDSLGLLAFMGAIFSLVFGIVEAIQLGTIEPLWIALVTTVILVHVMMICLCPEETVNIDVRPGEPRAGETALSTLAFLFRAALILGVFVFGFGCAACAVWMLVAVIYAIGGNRMTAVVHYGSSWGMGVAFALTPFTLYLAYLLYVLFLDLYHAVFEIARNTRPPEPESE